MTCNWLCCRTGDGPWTEALSHDSDSSLPFTLAGPFGLVRLLCVGMSVVVLALMEVSDATEAIHG